MDNLHGKKFMPGRPIASVPDLPTVKISLVEGGTLPQKAHPGDACYDCYVRELPKAKDYEVGTGMFKIPLGFKLDIPPGWKAMLWGRSGLACQGAHIHIGTIDHGYRQEVCCITNKLGWSMRGAGPSYRVCQMSFEKVHEVNLLEVDDIDSSGSRGGFGSTGIDNGEELLIEREEGLKFYEFFAGAGMARAGLGPGWHCLFANDFDPKKSISYRTNWGDDGVLLTADIRTLRKSDIPDRANLVWGSFPCQDLSLAGASAGLRGKRSGTFWPFWDVMKSLIDDGRAPDLIVLENVCGTLTSHEGKDFSAICSSFADAGYDFGALVIDAADFVPQSRPRLFIVGVRRGLAIPDHLIGAGVLSLWHPKSLQAAFDRLPQSIQRSWIWWSLPAPPGRKVNFADIIEEAPSDVKWHTALETATLLSMMSPVNLAKVEQAKKSGKRIIGGVYKRTRGKVPDKLQRAEVRFDNIAGCLRTPSGGSSRQSILVVEGEKVRSRLLSTREAARLMGLPETYVLPTSYNEAYHLIGDGVAVPVVRYLAHNLFEVILAAQRQLAHTAG